MLVRLFFVIIFFIAANVYAIELKKPSENRHDIRPPTTTVMVTDTTVPKNSHQRVIASSTDDVGVVKTEIYINGILLCEQAAALATCSWEVPAIPNRTYIIQGKAYDADGNVGASPGRIVTSR